MVSITYLDNVLISHAIKHSDNSKAFRELIGINPSNIESIVKLNKDESLIYKKMLLNMNSILYIIAIVNMKEKEIKQYELVKISVTSEQPISDSMIANKMIVIRLDDLKRKETDEYEVYE